MRPLLLLVLFFAPLVRGADGDRFSSRIATLIFTEAGREMTTVLLPEGY